jgi:hypothetical protein
MESEDKFAEGIFVVGRAGQIDRFESGWKCIGGMVFPDLPRFCCNTCNSNTSCHKRHGSEKMCRSDCIGGQYIGATRTNITQVHAQWVLARTERYAIIRVHQGYFRKRWLLFLKVSPTIPHQAWA